MYAIFTVSWQVTLVCFIRIFLAFILGVFIGIEREHRRHPAGIRTMSIVAVASALFTTVSIYAFDIYAQVNHSSFDPGRIASYIPQGVTFLCLGSIYVFSSKKGIIRGLTTAVTIWMVAAIGMACGTGMGILAIILTVLVIVSLHFFRPIEARFFPDTTVTIKKLELTVTVRLGQISEEQIIEVIAKHPLTIESSESYYKAGKKETFTFVCQITNGLIPSVLKGQLKELTAVIDLKVSMPKSYIDPMGESTGGY